MQQSKSKRYTRNRQNKGMELNYEKSRKEETKKTAKCQNLTWELKELWNMKVWVARVITVALGRKARVRYWEI